ncbi:flagellar export protein FliJ [Thalassotalea profundi]|uniref:Flagellar FliJ protein n=1 Tax=Thalassotalea profundi TaxID=2036687 RepID=A0ABQ3IF72_9GAMM|nr:flagellar export protein FliJ [Thalassotalea profundi]GHE80849.1 flagellar protein FliJ [Thalassotalea profundi]
MSLQQLNILYKYEYDKERKAAQQLQIAEQDYQQNLLRLQNVGDYRLEYMRRLDQRSLEGIDSATYRHFHAFIAKLDNAAEQVEIAIKQAKALVEQRKSQWLTQRQKVKAVEHLQQQKIKVQEKINNKREQNMLDEFSTQQYVRRGVR